MKGKNEQKAKWSGSVTEKRRKAKRQKIDKNLRAGVTVEIIPARSELEPEQVKTIRVAAYCRVSTDQDAQTTSYEYQVDHFQKLVAANPEWELVDIYADEGLSGTNAAKRKDFQRMIADCKSGRIDMVITKDIRRFARNTLDCLYYVRLLKDLDPPVAVYFEGESLNTLDAKQEAVLALLSSVAQGESENKSEAIKWSYRHRFSNGIPMIPTWALLGYTEDEYGNLIISPSTISELNKKAYVHIEDWRNRPLQGGRYPYVYVDGIYLRRNWGGAFENVAILGAIAVNEDGYREVLGAAEGMKEDKASWISFFQWLRGRGLDGVKLVVGDKCLGMLEAVGEVFPEAKYQRCTVHFYRNVFSVTPRSKVKLVAKMLKAIHAQESKKSAREKAKAVVEQLHSMKLKEAAKKVEDGIEETLTYCDFPSEHWTRIRTNNVIERLNREIRRRTRVVGSFPDGNSALMLVCARLRYVAGTQWGNKKYMNMKHLEAALEDASIAG